MQIFVTDPDPIKSAKYLDIRRRNKMIVESAQLLSNAMWLHGGQGPYKLTHKNTKISKWVCLNDSNYWWLLQHFVALNEEFYRDTNKHHRCAELIAEFWAFHSVIPKGELTPFVNNAKRKDLGLDFTHLDNVFEAYKQYLDIRWKLEKKNDQKTNY